MTDTSNSVPVEDLDIEIPDAVLDAEDEDRDLPKHSVPAGIKYGLPVFGLVVVLLGYAVYLAFSGSSPEEALVFEQDEMIDIAGQEPIARPPKPVPVNNLVDMSTIDSLKSELETLAGTVSDSASLISKQTETVDLQNKRIQQVMASLDNNQTLLSELTSVIDDLNTRLKGLEGSVGNNSQQINQLTSQRKRQPRARPDFNLLSIDQWGGQDSVVLELQNSTTMAAVGDIRAGWTIESIDRPNCISVVRLSDKAKARVCRKSNS